MQPPCNPSNLYTEDVMSGTQLSHPPAVQTFWSQGAANQKEAGLKLVERQLKQLVSDRG